MASADVLSVILEKLKLLWHKTEDCTTQSTDDIRREIQTLIYILNQLSDEQSYQTVVMYLNLATEEFDRMSCISSDVISPPACEFTKLKGRPKLYISPETIEFYIECGFGVKEIALLLGVSKRTLNRRLADMNISLATKFANITNDDLDIHVQEIIHNFSNVGYRTVKSHLACRGLIVQQERVQDSLRRIDLEGVLFRQLNMKLVLRRKYSVRAPLSLWHIDGYHKLISWRLVIHGGIDGYSRLPVFLEVNDNNSSGAVLLAFQKAVMEFGLPERVRSDKGGENIKVAEYMLRNRGTGSHIAGRSVHNQRIERFWRDLWTGCISIFYGLFCNLEHLGQLNPCDEIHMKALHFVYIPRIQQNLDRFREAYMRRPLRTANSRTPLQLWVSGQALDPSEKLEESEVNNYGIDDSEYEACSIDRDVVNVDPPEIEGFSETDLRNTVNPFSPSDNHGMDLYIAARDFLILKLTHQ